MEHVPDPQKGDRFLLELLLTDNRTGRSVFLSEHVYRSLGDSKLCYPEGFRWEKHVTVNIIVPVRNAGRWALYFIKNIAGTFVSVNVSNRSRKRPFPSATILTYVQD